jgi:hypothetical protein
VPSFPHKEDLLQKKVSKMTLFACIWNKNEYTVCVSRDNHDHGHNLLHRQTFIFSPFHIMKREFLIFYRERPGAELKSQRVMAHSRRDAELKITFENEVTHNEIEFTDHDHLPNQI